MFKLINQDRTTRKGYDNETTWPIGEWREATGDPEQELCSDGWLHCYTDPYLALFLNPIHADIDNPIVCEVEVKGESKDDNGLKTGYRKMRVVRDLDISPSSMEQRVKFAILCALEVYKDDAFVQWANNWLSGKDRSARATEAAVEEAAEAAARATEAAEAAAWAAEAAAWAAEAWATEAAEAAARATEAAAWAARATEAAAWAAEARAAKVDLVSIAHKVMEVD